MLDLSVWIWAIFSAFLLYGWACATSTRPSRQKKGKRSRNPLRTYYNRDAKLWFANAMLRYTWLASIPSSPQNLFFSLFLLSSSRYSDSAFSARLLLHFPPYTYIWASLSWVQKKRKKFNICTTYLFALDSCSFNKQVDNPRKQKKKADPCLGMQAFFCPQQHNIPFLSWGFACKSEKKFFKQLLHRLTVIRFFLPIHIWVLSFPKKKRRKTKNPLVWSLFSFTVLGWL